MSGNSDLRAISTGDNWTEFVMRNLGASPPIDVRGGASDEAHGYGYMGTVSNHDFALRTSNKPRLFIDKDGNVGIGTTNPQRTLHINDVMRLEPRATAPPNPAEGDIYYDSVDHMLKFYDGTAWRDCYMP